MLTAAAFDVPLADGERLAGTFVGPVVDGPGPAVLIVNGSGPLDRDSNQPELALDIAPTLAAAFALRGIASARFDKRGVGASTGEYLSTGFDQETTDAAAALDVLRALPEVDPERIVVVGHSVGATVAIRLAAASDVAGVVLLSGSAQRGDEVVRWQTERIAATMTGLLRLGRAKFLRNQADVLAKLPDTTDDVATFEGETLPARWFREYLPYDPAPDLARISCPVLAITGRKDLQVDADDVARIGSLVGGPFQGETPPDLTHLLRHDSGSAGIATYSFQAKRPPAEDVMALVGDWVASTLAV